MTDMAAYVAQARADVATLIDEFQAGTVNETQALRQALRLLRRTLRALAYLGRMRSYTADLELEAGSNTHRTVTVEAASDTEAWGKAAAFCQPHEYVRAVWPGVAPEDESDPV